MKDINNWQSKFAPCEYYYRLMEKLHQMNQGVNMPIDLDEVKKLFTMPRNIMAAK